MYSPAISCIAKDKTCAIYEKFNSRLDTYTFNLNLCPWSILRKGNVPLVYEVTCYSTTSSCFLKWVKRITYYSLIFLFYSWIDRDKCEAVEVFVQEWLELGVRYVGGCCRTYAADVSRIRNQVHCWRDRWRFQAKYPYAQNNNAE